MYRRRECLYTTCNARLYQYRHPVRCEDDNQQPGGEVIIGCRLQVVEILWRWYCNNQVAVRFRLHAIRSERDSKFVCVCFEKACTSRNHRKQTRRGCFESVAGSLRKLYQSGKYDLHRAETFAGLRSSEELYRTRCRFKGNQRLCGQKASRACGCERKKLAQLFPMNGCDRCFGAIWS